MTVIAGGLITLEFAAAGLKYTNVGSVSNPDNTARDADLTAYVQAATPVIEDICGPVLQVTKTVKYNGGTDTIVLRDVVSSVTSVVEVGNTITDWFLDPNTNIIYGGSTVYPRVFYPGRLSMAVTYVTGYATVPMPIQLATRELVRFWIEQGNQANRPAFGDGVESAAYTPQGFAVPKRVMELCAPYRRLGGFA